MVQLPPENYWISYFKMNLIKKNPNNDNFIFSTLPPKCFLASVPDSYKTIRVIRLTCFHIIIKKPVSFIIIYQSLTGEINKISKSNPSTGYIISITVILIQMIPLLAPMMLRKS